MAAIGFPFFIYYKNVDFAKPHFFFKVKNIYIHDEMFSIQNGLLTPTLKAKRPELKEFFKDKIEELYSSVSLWRPADLIVLLNAYYHRPPAVLQHMREQVKPGPGDVKCINYNNAQHKTPAKRGIMLCLSGIAIKQIKWLFQWCPAGGAQS